MEKIKLTIPTGVHHGAQIITGIICDPMCW